MDSCLSKIIVFIAGCKYKVPSYLVLLPEKAIEVGTVLYAVHCWRDKLLVPAILANTIPPPQ